MDYITTEANKFEEKQVKSSRDQNVLFVHLRGKREDADGC